MDWKCLKCGGDKVEEVLEGVTQTSIVNDVAVLDDGAVVFDYGNTATEGGDIENIRFQCLECGANVRVKDLLN